MPEHATDPPAQSRKRRRSPPPQPTREYLTRRDLLALVPLSMAAIDNLERAGVFPKRFRIEPTTRVAWKRREVAKFIEARAARRVHAAERNKLRLEGMCHDAALHLAPRGASNSAEPPRRTTDRDADRARH